MVHTESSESSSWAPQLPAWPLQGAAQNGNSSQGSQVEARMASGKGNVLWSMCAALNSASFLVRASTMSGCSALSSCSSKGSLSISKRIAPPHWYTDGGSGGGDGGDGGSEGGAGGEGGEGGKGGQGGLEGGGGGHGGRGGSKGGSESGGRGGNDRGVRGAGMTVGALETPSSRGTAQPLKQETPSSVHPQSIEPDSPGLPKISFQRPLRYARNPGYRQGGSSAGRQPPAALMLRSISVRGLAPPEVRAGQRLRPSKSGSPGGVQGAWPSAAISVTPQSTM